MLPMFDSRYVYTSVDAWYNAMRFPSQWFKYAADTLDERMSPVNHAWEDANPSLTKLRRCMSVRLRLAQRLTQSYEKPAFGITHTEVNGAKVEIVEECVFTTPFCHLLHFKKEGATGQPRLSQPRLLMVAPMAGHYATLLRDTVRDSLPHFDVYVTDWQNARDVPISHGAFDFDSCIAVLVRCFEHLSAEPFHVMGVCQSGVPVYAAVALLEDNEQVRDWLPSSVTLMGSPIDTRQSPTSVNTYAMQHNEDWFEHTALTIVPEGHPGERRLVYPGFMQLAAFLSMHPERHQKSIKDAMQHYVSGDFEGEEKISSFYGEYCSVMDLTAEFYLQTVRVVFQEALLPQGKLTSRGRKVDPGAIRQTPIFAVEGELDDICGLGQTRAALDLATQLPESKKSYLMLPGAGHYGLFNGHRYRETVLPRLLQFTGNQLLKKAG